MKLMFKNVPFMMLKRIYMSIFMKMKKKSRNKPIFCLQKIFLNPMKALCKDLTLTFIRKHQQNVSILKQIYCSVDSNLQGMIHPRMYEYS